jgi:hypothetical protein
LLPFPVPHLRLWKLSSVAQPRWQTRSSHLAACTGLSLSRGSLASTPSPPGATRCNYDDNFLAIGSAGSRANAPLKSIPSGLWGCWPGWRARAWEAGSGSRPRVAWRCLLPRASRSHRRASTHQQQAQGALALVLCHLPCLPHHQGPRTLRGEQGTAGLAL